MTNRGGVDGSGIALEIPTPLSELVRLHGGIADSTANARAITRIAPLDVAGAGDLAPLLSRRYLDTARRSEAVLLVARELADELPEGSRWIHPHASYALAGMLEPLAKVEEPPLAKPAYVSEEAVIAKDVRIAPGAVILAEAVVGEGCEIEPNVVIYGRVVLGARVRVGAGAVLGRPGFGWAFGPKGAIRRMPQLGGVVVEDDVEIGPLSTIDAGTLGPTRLGRGCRLDAQVHIAHNVTVGEETLVAAQSGFAGSVRIGRGVLVGGQVGVADHVTIGDRARLAAQSGVIGDIESGKTVAGYPAVDRMRWLRTIARMLRGG